MRDAVERRPEPRRLELQAAQLRVEREWARNQLAPAIDLTLAASQDLGAATPGLSAGQGRPAGEVWLTLEIPILNRVARGRVAAAEAGVARLSAQARFARDRVAAEVRDARSALTAARRRVEIARQEVDAAETLESGERARFDAGDSTLLIVNLREQAAAEARLREVDARLDQRRAAAAWTAVTAALDDEPDGGGR
ncbi:MAG: TolC family protein [Polyangiales bacterium]